MRDHRYSENARQLEDDIVSELTTHQQERSMEAEEKQAARLASAGGGLDAIAAGTPLDRVKAIIEKKHTPGHELKKHEAGKKMASMSVRGMRAIEQFLGTKG